MARKGNYVFGLKENQPSLLADVRMYFEDADDGDSFNTFQTIEKNAGRIEKRICRKARDIAWLAAHKWPGLRSVFAVERIVDVRGMLSKETSYYISSSDVSARELLGAVREHWKIESLHWLLGQHLINGRIHIGGHAFCENQQDAPCFCSQGRTDSSCQAGPVSQNQIR